jgi:hypothetical protein
LVAAQIGLEAGLACWKEAHVAVQSGRKCPEFARASRVHVTAPGRFRLVARAEAAIGSGGGRASTPDHLKLQCKSPPKDGT